jgi:hypothetical protein
MGRTDCLPLILAGDHGMFTIRVGRQAYGVYGKSGGRNFMER